MTIFMQKINDIWFFFLTLGKVTFSSIVIFGKFLKKIYLDLQNQIFVLGAPFLHWLTLSLPVIKIFVTHIDSCHDLNWYLTISQKS